MLVFEEMNSLITSTGYQPLCESRKERYWMIQFGSIGGNRFRWSYAGKADKEPW